MSRKILGLSKRNWKCFIVGNIVGWTVVLCALACRAGVPVKFTVETSRADTYELPCYHGETLDFEVTFKNYGKDLILPTNETAEIFWQTNGMSAFFWHTNTVQIVENRMLSTFTPDMDPGTGSCFGFIGIPKVNYRAAFVLRFKNSPGTEPKTIEWPYRDLDFAKIKVMNAPYFLKGESYSRAEIMAILAAYDFYAQATNREEVIVSNLTAWARSEFREKTNSYTIAQINSFIQTLETREDGIDAAVRQWARNEFREKTNSYTIAEINTFVAQLQTKADAIRATNTLDQTIRDWANVEFQKSWELEEVQLGKDARATGTRTTAIGAYAVANGISSIAFGNGAQAKGIYPIAIGLYSKGTNGNSVAVGSYSDAALGGIHIGSGGQWSHGYAYNNAVAIGNTAKAVLQGIAIGQGAEAGNQSIAIGRDAKARHTAAAAIGATAESVGDSTMRIKYSPSEIYIGFWQAKSLQQYFDEIAPDIDWSIASNIVKNAEFLPTKYYNVYRGVTNETARWEWSTLDFSGSYTTTLKLKPANANSLADIDIEDGTMLTLENGGRMNVMRTGEMWVPDPNVIVFGSGQNQTNLTEYIKAHGRITETDPTISAWAKAGTKPSYSAAEVGAMSATDGATLATQVGTIGSHLNAEDAKFVVTNYDSVTRTPEASMLIKLPSGEWRKVWEEMRRWNEFTGAGFSWNSWSGFWGWKTNLENEVNLMSPKEYAFYDGVTGEVAPDGIFWMSQPRIGICAGAGYQKYVESGAAVWLLESNGMVANVNGTTNGYFRITDEEGNSQFEIVKGERQTLAASCRSMTSEDVLGVTHWTTVYAVTNAVAPPVAKFSRSLSNPSWIADTDPSCPMNVTWTAGTNSTYTLEFWPKGNEPVMFVKADYDRGGETKIRQTAPCEMQYVIISNTKYRLVPKTINGELVMGLATE